MQHSGMLVCGAFLLSRSATPRNPLITAIILMCHQLAYSTAHAHGLGGSFLWKSVLHCWELSPPSPVSCIVDHKSWSLLHMVHHAANGYYLRAFWHVLYSPEYFLFYPLQTIVVTCASLRGRWISFQGFSAPCCIALTLTVYSCSMGCRLSWFYMRL